MHTLHVTYNSDGKGHVRAIKAIREASKYLRIELNIKDAKARFECARDNGYVLIGESESALAMDRAMHEIVQGSDGTLEVYVDVPEEKISEAIQATREVMDDSAPDVVVPEPDRPPTLRGADMAIVLMGNAKGVALQAAEHALSLKRVTHDPIYDEALRALARSYPFIKDVLSQNGLWPA